MQNTMEGLSATITMSQHLPCFIKNTATHSLFNIENTNIKCKKMLVYDKWYFKDIYYLFLFSYFLIKNELYRILSDYALYFTLCYVGVIISFISTHASQVELCHIEYIQVQILQDM